MCYTSTIMMQTKFGLNKSYHTQDRSFLRSPFHTVKQFYISTLCSLSQRPTLKSNVILWSLSILTAVLLKIRPFIKAIRSNLALVIVLLELFTLLHLFSEKYNSVSRARNSSSKQNKNISKKSVIFDLAVRISLFQIVINTGKLKRIIDFNP